MRLVPQAELDLETPVGSPFREPYIHRVARRCRRCGERITVYLLGGATAARDPFYTCGLCVSAPAAFPDRLAEIVNATETPQLELVEPSERTETLSGTKNEKSRREAGSLKDFGEDEGEPTQAGGQPQDGGRR